MPAKNWWGYANMHPASKDKFCIFYDYGCYLTVTKTDAVLLEQNCKVDQLRLYDLKDIDDEVGRSSQCLL